VNVAVLDTGIRFLDPVPPLDTTDPKPDVADVEKELNIGGGGDCSGDSMDGDRHGVAWKDVDGHGTHVAGTIGAKNDGAVADGTNIIGVAPGVKLWSVRIFRKVNGSVVGDTATVACGVDWVKQTHTLTPPDGVPPIDVANMSIQGPRDQVNDGPSCTPPAPASAPTDPEHLAICDATTAGVTFVVAAGNYGRDAQNTVPGAYDEVITVAALADYDGQAGGNGTSVMCGDPDDTFAGYSNYGPAVDLIAPGSCIVSLAKTAGDTLSLSGTSMATPHVSGAAARYVALLLETKAHAPANINLEVIREGLRAAAGFDWDTSTDPDGVPDRLLNVAALTASDAIALASFPSVLKIRAPSGSPDDDSPPAPITVQLQRIGLYEGDVNITTLAALPTGITMDAPVTMSGLGPTGISQVLTFHTYNTAVDGDYPVTLHAAGSGVTSVDKSITLRVDRHRPTVDSLAGEIVGTSLSSAVPVRVSWAGHDPGGQITRYDVQRKVGTSGWQSVAISPADATSTVKLLAPKTDYLFRVRAVDAVGNVGDWSNPVISLRLGIRDSSQPSINYAAGAWSTKSKSTAYGGSFRQATATGAFAVLSFNGQSVAWVAPVGPGKGTANVRLDGGPAVLVDLNRPTVGAQRIVWTSGPLADTSHTLRITLVTGPVTLDAILILG
jgi:hypothetical protein